jgi:VWFA-related protein
MRPRLRISFLALPLFFALAVGLAAPRSEAQGAAPPPAATGHGQAAANPGPAANLVTLDVVVSDKLGHPVRGLSQQDFTVLDNGQPRPIVSFRPVDASTDPAAVRVLIVIDMINNSVDSLMRERQDVSTFLGQDAGRLAHPTAIAAMTETGVQMMNGYTQDGQSLLAIFQKLPNSIRPVGRDAGFYGAAERLQESINGLSQIVQFEGTQPGRKLVLFVSPGWPMLPNAGIQAGDRQRAWVFNMLVQMSNTLRESHVALYSLNPFFLGRDNNPYYYQSYLKPIKKAERAEYPYLAMQVFSEHSGGRALTEGHDIAGAINNVLRDAGAYYEITFDAPAPDQANEYHELRVQTTRPDTTARTNAFYYARPTPLGGGKTVPPSKVPEPSGSLPR